MTGEKPDRRVQRTRKLLHKALMSSVIEKKYESITVQEILDRADVGRSTFYTHFRDKDELLISGFQYLKNQLASVQASSGAASGKSYERIVGFSLAMFEHVNESRRVIRALLGSNAETVVRRHLHSALAAIIHPEVKTEFQRRASGDCPVTPELLTHFLVSTYISVLTWWLNSKTPVPPKSVDAAYRQVVLPCLASIFGERQAYKSA
ncbi:MAG TPA: TetR/AcrR family transcriptional regulator [Candidatus Acidoferrales bacterium]|nr:TetR/AcrR family transcriptional regulator [Candidatus Acidoferrales bacterium]